MLRRAARRILLGAVFTAAALPVLAWSVLPAALRAGAFRDTISARLSDALGVPVRVDSVDIPDAATVVARGVRLDRPAPGVESAAIEFVRVRFERIAPLGDPVEVVIEGLDARVAWKRAAATPPAAASPKPPARIPRLVLARARISGTIEGRAFEIPVLEASATPAGDGVDLVANGLLNDEPLRVRGRARLGEKSLAVTEFQAGSLRSKFEVSDDGVSASFEPFVIPPMIADVVKELSGLDVRGTLSAEATLAGSTIRVSGLLREAAVGPASGSPSFSASATRSDGSWSGSADLGPLDVELPGGRRARIESLRVRGSRRDNGAVSATIAFSGLSTTERGFVLADLGGVAEISGTWPEADVTVRLEQGTLSREPNRESLAGVRFSGRVRSDGMITGGVLAIPGLATLALEGRGLRGTVTFESVDLAAVASRLRAWKPGVPGVSGLVSGRAEILDGSVSARLKFDLVGASVGPVTLAGLSGELPLFIAWGEARPESGRGELRWTDLSYPNGRLGERSFSVASGLNRLAFTSKELDLSLERKGDSICASVDVRSLAPMDGLTVGSAALEATYAGRRVDGSVRFASVAWKRPDLEVTNVEGSASASIAGSTVAGRLKVTKAEVLAGDTYADLEGATLEVHAAGRRDGAAWRIDEGIVTLSDVGTLRGHGVWAGKSSWASVESSEIPIEAVVRRAESILDLKGVRATGTAKIAARIRGTSAEGTLTLLSVDAAAGKMSILGLAGEIPFIARSPSTAPQRGWVAFESAALGTVVDLGPRRLALTARSDALSVDTPMAVGLWGGEVRIEDVEGTWVPGGWRAAATLQARADLSRAAAALGWTRPLAGTLDVRSGRMVATPERVILDSPVRVSAFGGTVEIRNLRLLQPLDPVKRAAQFGFRVAGLRLGPAFRAATEHGVMDGVVDAKGEVELHGSGKPNWFKVEASTRETEGVPQELDLKAVKKLARQLGSDPASLDPLGIRTFSYERMGFYAVLDPNWMLYVRGRYYVPRGGPDAGQLKEYPLEDLMTRKVAPGDPVEYIIKGRQPSVFGQILGKHGELNVINSRPGNGTDFAQVWRNLGKISLGDPVNK